MSKYYCPKCAKNKGLISGLNQDLNFSGSVGSYLREKFEKHTQVPTGSAPDEVISVFKDPNYDSYKDYIVNTHSSGSVEIDHHGRVNILLIAERPIGEVYKHDLFQEDVDAVKLVIHHDPSHIHSYPTSSYALISKHCENCGNPIYNSQNTS